MSIAKDVFGFNIQISGSSWNWRKSPPQGLQWSSRHKIDLVLKEFCQHHCKLLYKIRWNVQFMEWHKIDSDDSDSDGSVAECLKRWT